MDSARPAYSAEQTRAAGDPIPCVIKFMKRAQSVAGASRLRIDVQVASRRGIDGLQSRFFAASVDNLICNQHLRSRRKQFDRYNLPGGRDG